ncbi:radical SAM protein [Streptomyces sp. URMC 123]|uniref:radical SAM protein n=1 Tax=Streptomyces sp. URMC 123 TaxID=3423403 RepID=UPI003F1BB6F9
MRWDHLAADALGVSADFRDITFHEITARSMLNRMRGAPRGGVAWTFNPYRGCSHACTYCLARDGHDHLGLGVTTGFSSQIVVKTNAAAVLESELRGGRARGDWVMMGVATDCYQRAEGRYRLMPGILRTLAAHRISFTTATKSPLLARDLDLFAEAAERAPILVMTSLGSLDDRVRRAFEPAAAPPRARLELVHTLARAGIPAGVLLAPIIPYIGDRPADLDALVDACAEAGAVTVWPDIMRISPAIRPWFFAQAAEALPHHLYQRLVAGYGTRRGMPDGYVRRVTAHIHARAARNGLPAWQDYIRAHPPHRPPEQLPLPLT